MSNLDWRKFLEIAYKKATESRHPSTQNGAILINKDGEILIEASNTATPDGVKETKERLEKPMSHNYGVCAERNAIYKAAKDGIKTDGLTMVCPWAACTGCAHGIIQSGIKRVVVHKQAMDRSGRWEDNIKLSFEMFDEAGVEIITYDGKVDNTKVLRAGEYWEP